MIALALKSLWNRRFAVALAILSVALSVALILGVERLRNEARESFANSASGIDLIVAARDNPVQILMATVFGVGSTSAALDWETFEAVEALPGVDWAVPISMGDNHRGHPVIGAPAAYFDHFRHSGGQALRFAAGGPFADAEGAVVGAEVAARFGYEPGAVIVNAHGAGSVAFDLHDEAPFTITGVLAPTGTAVDRMVLVSLEGFDALHAAPEAPPADPFAAPPASGGGAGDAQADAQARGHAHADLHEDKHEDARDHDHEHEAGDSDGRGHGDERPAAGAHDDHHDGAQAEPHGHDDAEADHAADAHDDHHDEHHEEAHGHDEADSGHAGKDHGHMDAAGHDHAHAPDRVNAIYVGLSDRSAVLGVQRAVIEYPGEALTAVLPNVALLELWAITGTAERALRLMAWAVAAAGLLGMIAMLSATLDARRREFAILRSVGATPGRIVGLIVAEAAAVTLAGIALGLIIGAVALGAAEPLLASRFGFRIGLGPPDAGELGLLLAILAAGLLASAPPALRVYRMTLADGLTIRM